MKQKWLATALIVVASIGALLSAVTVGATTRVGVALIVAAVALAVPLVFRRAPWWAWAQLGAVALALVAAVVVREAGAYIIAAAFLAAVGAVLELAAPRSGAGSR